MIRSARSADYAEMDAVFRASAKAFCSASYDAATIQEWTGRAWPDRFELGKEKGDEQYVFIKERRIACFGCLNLSAEKLVSLFVHPEFSGQNIGGLMLAYVRDRAASAGVKVLKLDSSKNAVNFYRRHGFLEVGHSTYTTLSGLQLDSVQMELALETVPVQGAGYSQ